MSWTHRSVEQALRGRAERCDGRIALLDEGRANRIASKELGLDQDGPLDEAEQACLAERVRALVYEPRPLTGLERLSANLLDDPRWSFLERRADRTETPDADATGPSWLRPTLMVVVALTALATVVTIVDAGHSGASKVWEDSGTDDRD